MSTPTIFIIIPFVFSILLFLLQKKERLVIFLGIFLSLLLGLFAIFQEFGQVWRIGSISVELKTTLPLLGRSFVLANSDRFFLGFIYFSAALFYGATLRTKITVRFIPISMAIVAIFISALAVEPFIYSAILIEVAVLISIPLMIQKGKPVGKGVLRFLIYQTLAVLLILYGGWLLSGIQASPSDNTRLLQASLILGIGFAFWLAVFPFQSWVPQLSSDIHPLLAGFMLGLFPVVTLFIMVDFISGLVWVRESQYLSPVLRIVGTIMVVLSGLWSTYEKDIRRIIGFAAIYETGFSLILISTQSEIGIRTLYISFVPKIFGLILLALSISIICQFTGNYLMDGFQGLMRKLPFASMAAVISFSSLAGFPLLAGFPVHLSALQQIGKVDIAATIWVIIGMITLLFSATRIFAIFSMPVSAAWQVNESYGQIFVITIGIIVLLILGIIPNIFGESVAGFFVNLPVLR